VKKSGERYLIRNARIVEPTRISQGDLSLEDGVISYVGTPLGKTAGWTVLDAAGQYVLPGFVDIHTHGGLGFDLTSGLYDAKERSFDPSLANYPDCLARLTRSLVEDGTTRVLYRGRSGMRSMTPCSMGLFLMTSLGP